MSFNVPSVQLPSYPTTAELLASLTQRLQRARTLITNYNAGGVTETNLEAIAVALGSDASAIPGVVQPGAYELLSRVQLAAFVLTANGADLDAKAADVGVSRKPAVEATLINGLVFFLQSVAISTIVIPPGAIVATNPADPTQPPVLFATTASAVIPAGQISSNAVSLRALQTGTLGNQVAGAITIVVSGAYNATCLNLLPTGGGANTEQDSSLRTRTLEAIPNAGQCTIVAIEDAALAYPGISSSLLIDNTDQDGVSFLRGQGQLFLDDGSGNLGSNLNPNNLVLASIQNDLNTGLFRAAGTLISVHGSALFTISVGMTIAVDASYALNVQPTNVVASAVQSNIFNYVDQIKIGQPVIVAEIIAQAMSTPGVSNLVLPASVLVNGAHSDVFMPFPYNTPRVVAGLSGVNVKISGALPAEEISSTGTTPYYPQVQP